PTTKRPLQPRTPSPSAKVATARLDSGNKCRNDTENLSSIQPPTPIVTPVFITGVQAMSAPRKSFSVCRQEHPSSDLRFAPATFVIQIAPRAICPSGHSSIPQGEKGSPWLIRSITPSPLEGEGSGERGARTSYRASAPRLSVYVGMPR